MLKKIKLYIVFFITLFMLNFSSVLALDIDVENVRIKDSSSTIQLDELSYNENTIDSKIIFNQINDFVVFEIELKNNDSIKYSIDTITDNNTNDNLHITYTYDDKEIKEKGNVTVYAKVKYDKRLENKEEISLNDLTINLSLIDEAGVKSSTDINPKTIDNINIFFIIFVIAIVMLIILTMIYIVRKKKSKKMMLLLIMFIPVVVLAKEKLIVSIKFTDIKIKGEMLPYVVSVKDQDGNITERIVKYGEKVGELPLVEKSGYKFDKYVDDDNNEVTSDTIVTNDMTITPKFSIVKYNISYTLNNGNVDNNPIEYTVEDEIILNNPTKIGYTFSGWTGSNGDDLQTRVTINKGTMGDLEYIANYSPNQDTKYTVIHRYPNLDGTYEEETEILRGATDSEVTPALKEKEGFTGPQLESVVINGDESTKVIYNYTRNKYSFIVTDRTYIDVLSTKDGEYYYETEIKVKAEQREGYTFKWSDGNTDLDRTFKLNDDIELTPIYTPNTDTKYTVIHRKMNSDGITYTVEDENEYEGITDDKVTPPVNNYEGFISPSVETITITGDGKAKVIYDYVRNKYTLSLEDANLIEQGDISGEYYYGAEITLTAKDYEEHTFEKWSNGENDKEILLIITEDVTIKPIYTLNKYLITFDSQGGTSVSNKEVESNTMIGELPQPTKENYEFDGWYTDIDYQEKVTSSLKVTSDMTLYAKWKEDLFPIVFLQEGACTFNGKNETITGDECNKYSNDTYIDTSVALYSEENYYKDFEIGFDIISYEPTNQSNESQITIVNTKTELGNGSIVPGFVFRIDNKNYNRFELTQTIKGQKKQVTFDALTIEKVKIIRINSVLYYSVNDSDLKVLQDFNNLYDPTDSNVIFGAAIKNDGSTMRHFNGTLSNMYIRLGKYKED